MIRIKNVSICKKKELIFKNLNIALEGKVAIIGANDSGKTKLLEALCGKAKIETGSIELDEQFLKKNNLNKRNNGFMYIPKDYYTFLQDLTVKHILFFFTKSREKSSSLLKEGEITPSMRFKQLSYIQKLILFIDIGIRKSKKIFLLDEPLLFLDMYERQLFRKVIDIYLADCMVIMTSTNPEERILDFNQTLFIYDQDLQRKNPFLTV